MNTYKKPGRGSAPGRTRAVPLPYLKFDYNVVTKLVFFYDSIMSEIGETGHVDLKTPQLELSIEAAYVRAADVMACNATMDDARQGIAKFTKRDG